MFNYKVLGEEIAIVLSHISHPSLQLSIYTGRPLRYQLPCYEIYGFFGGLYCGLD